MPAKTCQDRHPKFGTRCVNAPGHPLAHVDAEGRRWTHAMSTQGTPLLDHFFGEFPMPGVAAACGYVLTATDATAPLGAPCPDCAVLCDAVIALMDAVLEEGK